jgi:hypothetical protein
MEGMVAKGGRRLGIDGHGKASLKLTFRINFLDGRRFLNVPRQDGTGFGMPAPSRAAAICWWPGNCLRDRGFRPSKSAAVTAH